MNKQDVLNFLLFFIVNFAFSQIQTQIDNASVGDVIIISEGTYNESLEINKSITLQADGLVVLNVAGFTTGISIQTNISDVTIDGFTIIGNDLTGSGITVNPGASNILLTNNVIEGILLPGGGNTSPLSYGILCWGDTQPVNPPTDITIQGNSISNVLGSAISLGSNTENVLVSDNTFSDIIPVDLTGLDNFASIGIQAELSSGLGIQNNTYNDLTISNNLISCTDTYVSENTYNNSSLMLSTSFPHSITFNDAPWWSTTWSDGVSFYEAYYNDPTDLGYLYWVGLGVFTQNSLIPGCQDAIACNYNPNATEDDGSCSYPDENEDCDGSCVDGYTQMYLNYESVSKSTFNISIYPVEEIYSATISGIGVLDSCFPTELENECLAVEINGDVTWSLSWIGTGGNLNEYLNSETISDYATYNSDNGYYFGELCGYFAGCTDQLACNYNNSASINDGSCVYPTELYLDCFGACLNDLDGDGVCDEIEVLGCQDTTACNYDENATEDNGSCVIPTFENNIQCDECCMYSTGTWTYENAFYLSGSETPTLSASGENWSLSSSAFLYSEEIINQDGSITTTSWHGVDNLNNSELTSDCFNGQITIVLIFKTIEDNIVGDIVIKMFDDEDMYFETVTTVESFDLTTSTLTGSIEAGNSGVLIMIDSDENGVGDCDEISATIETKFNDKKIIKRINTLGQNVNSSTINPFLLYIYDDGSVERKCVIK